MYYKENRYSSTCWVDMEPPIPIHATQFNSFIQLHPSSIRDKYTFEVMYHTKF